MTTKQHKKTISKSLLLEKQTPSVLSILFLALMLVFLPNTALSCYYSGLDYLNITAGFGIKYHVTDDDGLLECNIWSVSQPKSNDGFAFTLTKNGNDGGTFSNSWLGGGYSCEYKKYMFDTQCPVDNQANHYSLFTILKAFDSGNQWTVLNKKYRVEVIGEHFVNGTSFNDCIKVTVDNSKDSDDYLKGNGHFILAKGIGIVQMVFNRENGHNVLFEYMEHGQQTLYTLCGTLSNTEGGSVEGLVVQLSNCDNAVKSAVDTDGRFTISVFGPNAVLRVGYDDDDNGEFDPDDYPDYPKEFHVNCLTSEVTTSDSGLDLQVNIGDDCESLDNDGDGVPDNEDNCPDAPNPDQANSDGDYQGNACDNCPDVDNEDQADADENEIGDACEVIDNDGDGDGIPDEQDNCPDIPNTDHANGDGDSHGDVCDNCPDVDNEDQMDNDTDGIGDVCDNCQDVANPDQRDSDGDCYEPPYSRENPSCGDACDNCPDIPNVDQTNSDGDYHGNACDNCPDVDNEDQADADKNGIGDACEVRDNDGDGIPDEQDNCPDIPNVDQTNSDGDYHGNVCDNCPDVDNEDQADADENGIGDACEVRDNDGDGDGIPDEQDNCPDLRNEDQMDNDADGIGDVCDNCQDVANPDQRDSDGDCYEPPYFREDPSCGDACDNCPDIPNADQTNSDGDYHGDACDNCQYVHNEDQADTDGDGIGDACDSSSPLLTALFCPAEELYGEHTEKTESLRYFRDNILGNTPEGKEIIRFYYKWSPVIVRAMKDDREFKGEVKAIIDEILSMISTNVE